MTWMPAEKRSEQRARLVGRSEPRHLPLTRADCPTAPCPYVSCHYHLGSEVTRAGSLLLRDDVPAMFETCALDVADNGEHCLDEIAEILGVTGERVRQILESALAKMARSSIMRELAEEE